MENGDRWRPLLLAAVLGTTMTVFPAGSTVDIGVSLLGGSWEPPMGRLIHATACDEHVVHRQPVITPTGGGSVLTIVGPEHMKINAALVIYRAGRTVKTIVPVRSLGRTHTFKFADEDIAEGSRVDYAFILRGTSTQGACAGVQAAVSPTSGSFQTLVTDKRTFNPDLFDVSLHALSRYVRAPKAPTQIEADLRVACKRYFATPTPCDLFDGVDIHSLEAQPETGATQARLPRIVRVTDPAVQVDASQSCTFQAPIWWWRVPALPVQHTGLTTANISYAVPMTSSNAIKQYTFAAAAFVPSNFVASAESRVGFAVGFQIGTLGGPTVNFQIDLNWSAHGVSAAQAAGTGLVGGLGLSSGHAFSSAVRALANVGGQNVRELYYEWESVGANVSSNIALPSIPVAKSYEDVAQTASWQLPLTAGQLYAFHIRFRTASEVANTGSNPATFFTNIGGANARSDFAIGEGVPQAILVPAQVQAHSITLTILDPEYFWETCNVV